MVRNRVRRRFRAVLQANDDQLVNGYLLLGANSPTAATIDFASLEGDLLATIDAAVESVMS